VVDEVNPTLFEDLKAAYFRAAGWPGDQQRPSTAPRLRLFFAGRSRVLGLHEVLGEGYWRIHLWNVLIVCHT
jgi:hypothetical protein